MKFEIKNWFSGNVMFSIEGENWKLAFTAAVKAGQSFDGANLSDRDFSGVEILRSWNATFYNATFDNAKFYNATFYNAKFDNATFDNATFDNATFDNATFDNAKFYNAKFDEKSWKQLPQPWLDSVRDDLFAILLRTPGEINFLRRALLDGKVNGRVYEGACACLVGTLANARKCAFTKIPGVIPNANRPAEAFFTNIATGHTPKNNLFAKQVVEWLDEFGELMVVAVKASKKK